MEEMNKDKHAEGCDCYACKGQKMCGMYGHCCGGHRHVLLRWLLGLLILVIVFWLGVKIGEFKGAFGGYGSYYYGMPRHMRSFNRPMMKNGYWGYPRMMGNTSSSTQPQSGTTPQK
jgi:hypothetical protein